MIVSRGEFEQVLARLSEEPMLSFDTETTGLMLWQEDRLFALAIGSQQGCFYFNFQDYEGLDPELVLPREYLAKLASLFQPAKRILFAHNAKFDMCALDKEGVRVESVIHDTEVGAAIERNDHLSYDLDACAKRIGLEKSDAVEAYIKEHHLWEWRTLPGKKTRIKNKFFYKVPFEIISKYALKDAEIAFLLGVHQIQVIDAYDVDREDAKVGRLKDVLELERRVTKAVFNIEKVGIAIDPEYCKRAIVYEDDRMHTAMIQFQHMTGFEFKDSNKHLAEVFTARGAKIVRTEKGNPSFDDEALEAMDDPAVKPIQEYRDAAKRANTYFRSFLFRADQWNVIHPNLRQVGAKKTFRFSCADPNLQNLSKRGDKGKPFPVRRAFVPRPGKFFVKIDYDQMEFRLMLDYAAQMDLIEMIKKGHDPHQATADLTGLERGPAKNLNFGLLYGMGIDKLAHSIGVDKSKAKRFKALYFGNLPRVQRFIKLAMNKAERFRKVRSWFGHVFHFSNPDFAYKAPNAIIQGGCAAIIKKAMPEIDELLAPYKSRVVLQIHDELDLEMTMDELWLVPKIVEIMERAYPYRYMPLTCSVTHSFKSLAEDDEIEGLPDAERDGLQAESSEGFGEAPARDGLSVGAENSGSRQARSAGHPDVRVGVLCGAGAEA